MTGAVAIAGRRRTGLVGFPVTLGWVRTGPLQRLGIADVDRRPSWIHPAEWQEAETVVDVGRRWQWLSGRLASRLALGAPVAAGRLRVLSRDGAGRGTRPRCWSGDVPLPCAVSIAHADGLAVVAASGRPVGVDVVPTPSGGRCASTGEWRWAAAEAAYKLLGQGPFEPRSWRVAMAGGRFAVRSGGRCVKGCFTILANHMVAICGAAGVVDS